MSPDHNAAPTDFDAIKSRWRVAHCRLNARLAGCTDWTTLASTSTTRKVLEGDGNVEDNVLDFPEGPVRALALGSFNPESRRWAIWWVDGRSPHQLDMSLIDGFSESRGQRTALFATSRTTGSAYGCAAPRRLVARHGRQVKERAVDHFWDLSFLIRQ